ncbi:FkbM family methyltransferase [Streptomyces sp. NPDC088725]|uniref:FkbM family methyltransferase n=1 Tax=Streptomyces sp. NPDC088725 TaxID=3365873 RepID=UPI003814D868
MARTDQMPAESTAAGHQGSDSGRSGQSLQRNEVGDLLQRLAEMAPHDPLEVSVRHRSTHLLNALFHDLVCLAEPALFVEAGAFEAETSVRVAAAVPGCRVVAFEANPYVYERFSASTDYTGQRVEYRHQALSREPGEVPIFLIASSSSWSDDRVEGYNSLLKRVGGDWLGDVEYEEVAVPATTLDHEFTDMGGRFAMWMDVEGATEMVLAGAEAFLDRCDVIKIEVEESAFWSNQWLVADVVAEMARHGLEPLARDFETEEQYNVLFGSRELISRSDVQSRIALHHNQASATATESRGTCST